MSRLLCVLFVLSCLLFSKHQYAQAGFKVYPKPADVNPSGDFKVFINGEEAFVYSSPVPASYCLFEMSKPVDIVIKATRDIKWVDIRPFRLRIKPHFKDSTISFRLERPEKLSIELNGSLRAPLFLFADAPEGQKPDRTDKNIIFFEAGKKHSAGIIKLTDNQSVYIEGGAVVVGAIEAKQARNIKVYGRGILDGTYNNRMNDSLLKSQPDTAQLRTMTGRYHRSIDLVDCSNITVEGLLLHNSTTWQIAPIHCDSVTIRDVKIVSDQASDDGVDVVRSRNVLIENCFIRTKDDCIAIKAHMNYPAREPVDNVVVQNNTFWNALWGNAIEIGFELNAAEVKNITFRNNDIIHVEAGAVISIHNAGTGHVKNILFDNIRIEDARQKLIDFAIFRSQYSEDGSRDPEVRRKYYLNGAWDGVLRPGEAGKEHHARYRGKISDVVLRNIIVVDGLFPFSIFYGYDKDHAIQNVRIENFVVHGRKITDIKDARFYIEETQNITIK